jgi:hypothetical protein
VELITAVKFFIVKVPGLDTERKFCFYDVIKSSENRRLTTTEKNPEKIRKKSGKTGSGNLKILTEPDYVEVHFNMRFFTAFLLDFAFENAQF